MFKTNVKGKAISVVITLSGVCSMSFLHMKEESYRAEHGERSSDSPTFFLFTTIVTFGVPFLYTTAYALSEKPQGKIEQRVGVVKVSQLGIFSVALCY